MAAFLLPLSTGWIPGRTNLESRVTETCEELLVSQSAPKGMSNSIIPSSQQPPNPCKQFMSLPRQTSLPSITSGVLHQFKKLNRLVRSGQFLYRGPTSSLPHKYLFFPWVMHFL